MATNSDYTQNKFLNKWTSVYFVVSAFFLCMDRKYLWNNLYHAWRSSGFLIQSQWDTFLNWFGDDAFNLYVYGMNLWNIFIFWTFGSIYLLVDLQKYPKWIVQHKVQPNVTINTKSLRSLVSRTLYNQLFVAVPFSIFGFYFLKYQGNLLPVRELPTFFRVARDIMILIPIQEVFAYYSHRLFHHRLLYKWTHKIHHEWTAPIALSAYYNHPLDHLVCNILPATVGLSILNSHLFTSWLWLTWTTLRTLSDHSGYHMFTFPSPQQHDFHHLKFTECFGVWGPLDYFHRTDISFRASLANQNQKNTQKKANHD